MRTKSFLRSSCNSTDSICRTSLPLFTVYTSVPFIFYKIFIIQVMSFITGGVCHLHLLHMQLVVFIITRAIGRFHYYTCNWSFWLLHVQLVVFIITRAIGRFHYYTCNWSFSFITSAIGSFHLLQVQLVVFIYFTCKISFTCIRSFSFVLHSIEIHHNCQSI